MKVGIIGSGGREHAICQFIKKSSKIDKIFCFPGNAGTKEITDLKVKLAVWNSTELLQSQTHYPGVLSPKQSVKLPVLIFDGPHADPYELIISMEFNSEEGKQILNYNYKIADYGNLAWHDQYFSF